MKQASISISQMGQHTKSALILLEGELVLGNIDKIKEQITAAIEPYSTLKIVLKHVDNIDLTGIQLLLAIRNSLQILQKQFSFDIELPEGVQVILAHAGFADLPALLAMQPISTKK